MAQKSAVAGPGHIDESANVKLVRNFFADWSKRDARILAKYMADDFAYQMIEGEPDIIGPEMFIKTLGDVLPGFVSINMEIRRIVGYGHIVMIDRYDRMTGIDEAHSMNFEVVGLVKVHEGKLSVLRDFPIPGGVFDLGSAWLEGSDADNQRLETIDNFKD